MINYVNNAYDKVLKPCDAQRFSMIVNSQETERLILAHRTGDGKAKSKLPALTYMGVLDTEKYSKYCRQCKEQDIKAQGSRKADFMRPTGLLMLDFDHVSQSPLSTPPEGGEPQASREVIDTPIKLWEYIKSRYESESPLFGRGLGEAVALAHITPSGDGLRLVLQRTKGKSIEQEQYEFCKAMGVKCDDVCKDISRLSFSPMQKEILYYNPSLLFAELPEVADYPNSDFFGQSLSPVIQSDVKDGTKGVEQYPTDYNGIEYTEIVSRLEEQLGGRPERGARNSFIFTMACNLRYICDDNADWIASILPTYGEEPQKHRMTIQSAVNRPMSREMPETLKRALGVAKLCSEADSKPSPFGGSGEGTPPTLPAVLPEPVSLLTSRTPERMKPAVAMSIFPSLGAHLHDVHFAYWDGRDYEPAFMHVLVGELSSGKSAVNTPIEYILADIEARDEVALEREREWKEKCACLSSTQERPERPKGMVVQVLPADMTNAAFVQRLADAEGHFLYTQMDEIELLDALKTNGRAGSVSAVLRLAFDCGKYGQVRVAANAISAMVRVRWNWNASTTVQRARKYFSGNIADGTLSRLSFSTIIKDKTDAYGRNRPKYLPYGDGFADELRPYIDRLNTCKGTLHCPEAMAWAEQLCDELSDFAEEMEDEAYATMSFRAVLMGFFRAMLLYVMNGMQWTREIADFAAWSVRYDLWCKMRFFSDMLHKDLEGEQTSVQRGPVSLLTMLPSEFTRRQVQDLRIAQGMKPNPKEMLKAWAKRGLVKYLPDTDTYQQVGTGDGDN